MSSKCVASFFGSPKSENAAVAASDCCPLEYNRIGRTSSVSKRVNSITIPVGDKIYNGIERGLYEQSGGELLLLLLQRRKRRRAVGSKLL